MCVLGWGAERGGGRGWVEELGLVAERSWGAEQSGWGRGGWAGGGDSAAVVGSGGTAVARR